MCVGTHTHIQAQAKGYIRYSMTWCWDQVKNLTKTEQRIVRFWGHAAFGCTSSWPWDSVVHRLFSALQRALIPFKVSHQIAGSVFQFSAFLEWILLTWQSCLSYVLNCGFSVSSSTHLILFNFCLWRIPQSFGSLLAFFILFQECFDFFFSPQKICL